MESKSRRMDLESRYAKDWPQRSCGLFIFLL